MKQFASIFILLALVLSACSDAGLGMGSAGDTAATVDGTVITVGDVEDLIYPGTEVIDKTSFARYLGAAIQIVIIEEAAGDEFGVVVPDEDIEAEAERIYNDNAQPEQSRDEFLEAAGISELLLSNIALQQLLIADVQDELATEPTQEELDAARRQAELSLAEVCAAHILVDTEEEALDVLDRLDSGEDFAAVAAEVSTDTGSGENGGDLGCSPPARYVEPFAEATMTVELNTPSDPVESTFGYHVIVVSDRTEANPDDMPSDEDLTAQLQASLATEAFTVWYNTIMADADVVVEEQFGTWTTDPRPEVIPPATDTTQSESPDTTVQ